ncbi:MAG TPA: hypothetical protein VHC04_00970 [Rhodopila sp.]|jgi:hypothetical protein|nr:hypothetical protein [Rhodopila sp.]
MASASGSEKISAASADASTTLTLVTIRPNDRSRIIWRADTEAPDLCEKLAGAQFSFRSDSFLDNGQQLTLQRSVMPLCPPAQTLNDLVGGVLDR